MDPERHDDQDRYVRDPGTPATQCDVVMKGGITSGVVCPEALSEIGASYRFRGVGGASAGAIGVAVGAAAEFGRSSGASRGWRSFPVSSGTVGSLPCSSRKLPPGRCCG
jgi:hypothetical protein